MKTLINGINISNQEDNKGIAEAVMQLLLYLCLKQEWKLFKRKKEKCLKFSNYQFNILWIAQ